MVLKVFLQFLAMMFQDIAANAYGGDFYGMYVVLAFLVYSTWQFFSHYFLHDRCNEFCHSLSSNILPSDLRCFLLPLFFCSSDLLFRFLLVLPGKSHLCYVFFSSA